MVSVSAQGWYLTLVLSLLSLNQSAVWFTFASVDPDIVTHHIPGMTKNMIRWSLLLGPIGYFTAFPFTTALATYRNGIQKCIIVSNVCVAGVCGLLCLVSMDCLRETEYAAPLAMFGLLLNAFVGPTVLSLSAPLAADWFSSDAQGLPISVSLTANSLGIILWFPLGPAMAPRAADLPFAMWVRAACAVAVLIMSIVYYPQRIEVEQPNEKLPLNAAENEKEHRGFLKMTVLQLRSLLIMPKKNVAAFVAVAVGVGTQTGVISAFGDFDQDVLQNKYGSTFLGWLGFGISAANVPGGLLGGFLNDTVWGKRHLNGILVSALVIELVLVIIMCCLIGVSGSAPLLPNAPSWVLVLDMTGIGFITGLISPVLLLQGIALAPDLPEALVGAWTSVANNVGYVVLLVFTADFLADWGGVIEIGTLVIILVLMAIS